MAEPIRGDSTRQDLAGVIGTTSANGVGVWGEAKPSGRAVVGVSDTGAGIWGQVGSGRAVIGVVNGEGTGLWGECASGRAVVGAVRSGRGAGVWGENPAGDGVVGKGVRGVVGESETYQGVFGWSGKNAGVVGESRDFHAVFGVSHSPNNAGLFGMNDKGGYAADLRGRVSISGTLSVGEDIILVNADCAEEFDVEDADESTPATVMVLTDTGGLRPCAKDFDTRVAGVVSGAGDLRPGITLGRRPGNGPRRPVALVGRVYCKADADHGAIGSVISSRPRRHRATR